MAVRAYESDSIDADALFSNWGLLSYGIGESFAFLSPVLLSCAFFVKERWKVISLVILTVGCLLIPFMAALTTSLLLSLLFCSLVLFINVKKGRSFFLMIVLLALVMTYLLPRLEMLENAQFAIKMLDVQESINEGQGVGQAGYRSQLLFHSIKVWLYDPILGLANVNETGILNERTISGHSALFDYLGLYGLFCVGLFVAWKDSVLSVLSSLDKVKKKSIMCGIFSLMGLLVLKGSVSIGINFIVSTAILSLIISENVVDFYSED